MHVLAAFLFIALLFMAIMYFLQSCENGQLKLKNRKLKGIILLSDKDFENEKMTELTKKQWLAYVKVFPDEGRY